MTFNIGNQNAGIINMAGRDQTIQGDQQGTIVSSAQARGAANDLRVALERTSLGGDDNLRRHVEDLDHEMRSEEPRRSTVATLLDRLARAMDAAGAWVTAGAAVLRPMRVLAQWLGHLGAPILGILPLLA